MANKIYRIAPVELPKSFFAKLLDFIEHPFAVGALFAIGGLVGTLLYTPFFALCAISVLLAFHRAKVVSGQPLVTQVASYLLLVLILSAGGYSLYQRLSLKLNAVQVEFAKKVASYVKPSPSVITVQPNPQPKAEQPIMPLSTEECHAENRKLVNCTDADIVKWGQPLVDRLNGAVKQYEDTFNAGLRRYAADGNKEELKPGQLEANAYMNRYLKDDFKNFVMYRDALVSHVRGGDSTGYDPVQLLLDESADHGQSGDLVLSDADSHLGDAQEILRYFQNLTQRVAQQVKDDH